MAARGDRALEPVMVGNAGNEDEGAAGNDARAEAAPNLQPQFEVEAGLSGDSPLRKTSPGTELFDLIQGA